MPDIAILLDQDMTALHAVGPDEVLARLPGADVEFVASTPGPMRTDVGLVLLAAAGVSAGIDMALPLAALEAGEDEARALQHVIEYDPDPPLDSGSLEKADAPTRRRATAHLVPEGRQIEVMR